MKLIITTTLLFMVHIAFCQEAYYVLHTQGQVKSSGKVLAARDKLLPEDELQFSSESAFLVVFSNASGRKIVRPINKSTASATLISYFVSENLFAVQNQLSTRGGDELTSFSEIKKYFDTPVLVIDTLNLNINKSALGINENNVLVFKNEALEIVGTYTESEWKTSVQELAPLAQTSTEIAFKDQGFGSVMPICDVSLVLKTFDELKQEIDFYSELSNVSFDELSLKDHIETVYGRFDTDYIPMLLK